jgi:O-antigen/teichoic acid export membrane protein
LPATRHSPTPSAGSDHREIAPQVRGSGLIFAASLFAALIELVSQVVLVRVLTKDEFGAFAFAIALVLFVQNLAVFGMPLTVSRFVPMRREAGDMGGLLGVLTTSVTTVLSIGVLCVIALLVAMALVPPDAVGPDSARLVATLSFLIPLEALVVTLTAVFATYGRTRAIVIRGSLVAPVLKLAVTASLVLFGTSVEFVAVGWVCASLVGAGLYSWMCVGMLRGEGLLRPAVRRAITWPWRELVPFASVALATTMVWACLEMSDAILLGVLRGPADVATMRAVTPFMRGYAIVLASFLVLFAPLAATYFARRDAVAMRQVYVRTASWTAILSFPVFLLTFVFPGAVVGGLYGAEYESSATVMMVLSIGYCVQAATGFNGQVLKIHGFLRYTLIVDMVAVAVNLSVNLLLIPPLGALGAAIGTSGTLVAHNALKQVALRRLTGVRLWDAAYGRLLMVAALLAAGSATIGALAGPSLPVACVVTAVATLLLVRLTGASLRIDESFPQVAGVPVLGRLLGLTRPAAGSGTLP